MNFTAHSTRIPRRHGGFTLLEVIFAMGILAIGLLAVAALLPVAAIQQKRALDDQLGTAFASSAVASIRVAGRDAFTTLTATSGTYTPGTIRTAYKISDPGKVFDYSVAYRMDSLGDPIKFLVTVFRITSPDAVPVAYTTYSAQTVASLAVAIRDDTATKRTILYGPSSGPPPLTTATPGGPTGSYADIFRKNQLVVLQRNGTVIGATNASPIVINATAHGLVLGDLVTVTGVVGNTAANCTHAVVIVDQDHFSLSGTTGSGAYVSGGTWSSEPMVVKVTGSADVTGGDAYITPVTGAFTTGTNLTVYCLTDDNVTKPAALGHATPTTLKAIAISQGVIP